MVPVRLIALWTKLKAIMRFRFVLPLFALVLPSSAQVSSARLDNSRVDFVRDIQPLFQQKCLLCHGPKQQFSNLRLDDPTSARRVIQPGKASDSKVPPGPPMPHPTNTGPGKRFKIRRPPRSGKLPGPSVPLIISSSPVSKRMASRPLSMPTNRPSSAVSRSI